MATIEKLYAYVGDDMLLLGVVQELEQLRKSQMQPATKYLSNTIHKQFKHMDSEMDEISDEYKDRTNFYAEKGIINIEQMAMEVIDLQFSCQTMLEGPLGLTKSQIANYIQQVVKKNADRDYDKTK